MLELYYDSRHLQTEKDTDVRRFTVISLNPKICPSELQ